MDLGLPEVDGITAIKSIKELHSDIKFVVLTSHSDKNDVLNSLKAGANAYCSKEINLQRLIEVVHSVLDGASWFDPSISDIVLGAVTTSGNSEEISPEKDYNLTTRERQILKLITEGYCNVEIAKQLYVSVNTTKVHVASILQKLEVDDRLQAAVKALKEHIV
jgi:DNA-binding NarL/FixJ family response regulator